MIYLKKLIRKNEFYVLITIIFFGILVEVRSGQFFTSNNIVDLIRSMIVPGLFAIGTQMVMISGGIDLSFTAIGALAGYMTTYYLLNINYSGNMILCYIIGASLGLLMGFLNGIIISHYNLSTLIVTLGTMSLFIGILFGGYRALPLEVPPAMLRHGEARLFTVYNQELGFGTYMPVTIFILIAFFIIAFFIMQYTMLGKGIKAIGGDEIAAQRVGFNTRRIKLFIYCFAGVLAGIAGVVRTSMMLANYPGDLIGTEMLVIAAVVLGGTRLTGGKGSLTGAILGIALITILSNSLILIGIPTYWQRIFTGLIIIVGTGITTSRSFKIRKRINKSII